MGKKRPSSFRKVRKLTLRQQAFIKNYFDTGGNATQAALRTYRCKSVNVAGVIGYQNLRKLNVDKEINNVLGSAMLTTSEMVSKLKNDFRGRNSVKILELACRLRHNI